MLGWQLPEEVVPHARRQIDVTISLIVEQRRNQEIVADEILIVDAVRRWIGLLLEREGAEHGNSRAVRRFVQRIEIRQELIAQIEKLARGFLHRGAVRVRLMVALAVRPHEGMKRSRREPARIEDIVALVTPAADVLADVGEARQAELQYAAGVRAKIA